MPIYAISPTKNKSRHIKGQKRHKLSKRGDFIVLVLLSVNVERFSVSCITGFFSFFFIKYFLKIPVGYMKSYLGSTTL